LSELARLAGMTVKGLLNKGSKTYKESGKELSGDMEVAAFLTANPKAMLRPLVKGDERLVMGFKTEEYEELLK
jgi:arsenate reductase-like glutaredoxin family protein